MTNPRKTRPVSYLRERSATPESQLMLARTFGLSTARFNTPEPRADQFYFSGALSIYAYAGHNPGNYLDPDGRSFMSAWKHPCTQLAIDVAALSVAGVAAAKFAVRATNFIKNARKYKGIGPYNLKRFLRSESTGSNGFVNAVGVISGLAGITNLVDDLTGCYESIQAGLSSDTDTGTYANRQYQLSVLERCRGGDSAACKELKEGCEEPTPRFDPDICEAYRKDKESGLLPAHNTARSPMRSILIVP